MLLLNNVNRNSPLDCRKRKYNKHYICHKCFWVEVCGREVSHVLFIWSTFWSIRLLIITWFRFFKYNWLSFNSNTMSSFVLLSRHFLRLQSINTNQKMGQYYKLINKPSLLLPFHNSIARRFMFTDEVLGIDKYLDVRHRIVSQFGDMKSNNCLNFY